MATECVVAVYLNGTRANLAVEKLTGARIPKGSISCVARSVKGAETDVKRALDLGDETERDATLGAGIGGLIGAIGGTTAISAAGVGVLIVAGPLVAITGAVVGGLIGAISGWGVHRDRAAEYQKLVADGKVLLIVHSDSPERIAEAAKLLQLTNPDGLHLHAKEDDGDDPRVDDR
jgi:hypothetical protein